MSELRMNYTVDVNTSDVQDMKIPWRNGSASDSRSEGCVFESRRGHPVFMMHCIDKTFLVQYSYNLIHSKVSIE